MKIFDCTSYYSEDLMLDIRFNVLNEKVCKFIVVESLFSHSGQKKKLNFDINNFKKFKDKIIYLVVEKEPNGIKNLDKNNQESTIKRYNSLLRIEQSYNHMFEGAKDALDDDLIILSDNDEIPNLNSKEFSSSKANIFIFKQLFFYYKLNLFYDAMYWYGSKACKKKKLISMSWLRNLKNKKYPIWRLDTYFSKNKYINLKIINDGGWHFTNLKTPEALYEKMKNFGHHNEFDDSGLNIEDIKNKIQNKEVFYDHFADKTDQNKWNAKYKLKNININLLPKYIQENISLYKEWLD